MSLSANRIRRHALAAIALTGAMSITGPLVAHAEPATFGLADLGSTSTSPAATPRLSSVNNFRDIAGPDSGYVGTGGLHVRRGLFYRSNVLTPSAADLAALESLGLTAVYDLRTEAEVAAKPETVPTGAAYTRISVLAADPSADIASLETPEQARTYVQGGYRDTANDTVARAGYGQLLTALAETSGPQVFNCTAGKDRTGWATALLLSIAGVSRETIVQDYLLSNEYSAATIQASIDRVAATKGEAAAAVYRELLGVDASYLEASFAEVDKNYGTFDRYLVDGLGLSPATIAKLKFTLLVG
ncbi:tyrosine-protein phosphatase [Rhodococcus sp. NPDC004095]